MNRQRIRNHRSSRIRHVSQHDHLGSGAKEAQLTSVEILTAQSVVNGEEPRRRGDLAGEGGRIERIIGIQFESGSVLCLS